MSKSKLLDDDCLLVGREKVDYRVSFEELAEAIVEDVDLDNYYTKSEVDRLVFSGDYNDLKNKPNIGDGTLTLKDTSGSTVGTFTANQNGNSDVTLFSGDYNDLENKPAIGDGTLTVKNADGSTAGTFTANQAGDSTVNLPAGFSGDFNDLINVPPANAEPGDGKLLIRDVDGGIIGEFTANQSSNSEVTLPKGFSGDYNDLTNKPAPPGNGTLTIKNSDGSEAGSFTANQTGNAEITLPAGFSGDYNDLENKPNYTPPGNGLIKLKKGPYGPDWGQFSVNQNGDLDIIIDPQLPDFRTLPELEDIAH